MAGLSRRQFLHTAAALAAPGLVGADLPAAQPVKRPRVAAIYTVFRFRSHAHNILENFLAPYLTAKRRRFRPPRTLTLAS